jgi:hypothetical protein
LFLTVTGWLDRRERDVLADPIEKNRVLRRQVGGRRVRLTHDDRRRLAARVLPAGPAGAANELIERPAAEERVGLVRRRQRLGRLLNYYARAA